MIDFHSHVIHGIDDGSRNVEESIKMMKMSFSQGIDTMVFTPHFRLGEHNIKSFIRERQERLDEIRAALTDDDREIIPKVILGAEVEYIPRMNRWDYLDKLCVTGTNYIMTEMPFIPWSEKVVRCIDDIALNSGLIPILPHIDRYFHTFTRPEYIEHYYDMPVKIQMNAIYLNDPKNIQFFKPLFEQHKIHILGSDCHSPEWRRPDLGSGVKVLERICGRATIDEIDKNGREILRDAIYVDM